MDLKEVEQRLSLVIEASIGMLPEEQLQDMLALVRSGEPGVALENYLIQLFEYDAVVPHELFREVRRLGQSIGIDEKHWQRLKVGSLHQ